MKIRREEDIYVETDYRVVYEDDCFLVVDKPAPLPVHPVGRFTEKNLLSLLRKHRPAEAPGFRIVNRLDSETSGLVLVAKSSEMAGKLGLLFEKRLVKKEYLAVVSGHLERSKGRITIALGTVHRRSLHMRRRDPAGEKAVTVYEVEKKGPKTTLVRVMPETGRKHQIRAHFAFIGHPVLGDKIYIDPGIFERYMEGGWNDGMKRTVKSERLLLHGSRLEFRHPATGEPMVFTSEPPALFEEFLDSGLQSPVNRSSSASRRLRRG